MRVAPLRKIFWAYEKRSCLVYRQDWKKCQSRNPVKDINLIRYVRGLDK